MFPHHSIPSDESDDPAESSSPVYEWRNGVRVVHHPIQAGEPGRSRRRRYEDGSAMSSAGDASKYDNGGDDDDNPCDNLLSVRLLGQQL